MKIDEIQDIEVLRKLLKEFHFLYFIGWTKKKIWSNDRNEIET